MTVAASISFQQGVSAPGAGIAMLGSLATLVTATNGNNAGIAKWRWTMLDVPPGSSVPTGVISDGGVNSTTFTPDVRGGYHLELVVTETGTGITKTDRRVFQVRELSGRIIPPFRAEAAALNFSAATRGWAISMEDYLRHSDGRAPRLETGTGALSDVVTFTNLVADDGVRFSGAAPVVHGLLGGYDGRVLVVTAVNAVTLKNQSGTEATATARIACPGNVDVLVPAGGTAVLLYDGTTARWRVLGASGAAGAVGEMQFHGATDALDATSKLKADPTTKELTYTGLPIHKETIAEFDDVSNGNTLGASFADWGSYQTTNATPAVIHTVSLPAGTWGDGTFTVTWEITVADTSANGGNIACKATFRRASGTLTKINATPTQNGVAADLTIAATAVPDVQDDDTIKLTGTGTAAKVNWSFSVHVQMAKKAV